MLSNGFNNLYVFGDSLSDCCVGGSTTGNPAGLIWTDILASSANIGHDRNTQNFAVGGAQSGTNNIVGNAPGGPLSGVTSQVNNFLATSPTINANDLVAIWIGTNDVTASAVVDGGGFINQPIGFTVPQGIAPVVNDVIANITANISALQSAGLQNFLLLSLYDMSDFDSALFGGLDQTYLGDASLGIRDALLTLSIAGANIHVLDVATLVANVQANAVALGFTSGTTGFEPWRRLLFPPTPPFDGAGDLATFVFSDEIHLSERVHEIIGNAAADLVTDASAPVNVPTLNIAALFLLALMLGIVYVLSRQFKLAI